MRSLWKSGLVACFALAAAQAQAADVTLKYSSWLPNTSWVNTDLMQPYFEEIKKVTEGRVEVELLPKTVGTAQSQYDVIRDGLADMSLIIPGYTPGRFTTTELGELPFLETNETAVAAPAFNRLFRKHLEPVGQYKDVVVLTMVVTSSGHVFNKVKEIAKVEDWAGLKLRSVGAGTTAALTALGAVPVIKPSSEAYEMLVTGALDGSLSGPENLIVSKLVDVVTYGTILPGGIYKSPVAIVANPAAWAKISPKDQEAINAISHEVFAKKIGEGYDKADGKAMETMKAKGTIKIIDADDTLVAAMKEKFKPLEEAWIAKAKAAGLADPAAVLEEFKADMRANSKGN